MPTMPPESFDCVLHAELDEIAVSRKGPVAVSSAPGRTPSQDETRQELAGVWLPNVPPQDRIKDHYSRARESELLGLSFSGGGIRSATFNLGILEGLAQYGLLPRVDYLSTVSGGGYIGSWFTAWIKRKRLRQVQSELAHDQRARRDPEPREITFLRQYSNYLTPQVGALSADTWTMVSIYLRNLLLNLTILVFGLGAAVAAWRLLSHLATGIPKVDRTPSDLEVAGLICLGSVFLGALVVAWRSVRKNTTELDRDCPETAYPPDKTGQGVIQKRVVVPVFVMAWVLSAAVISAPLEWRPWIALVAVGCAGFLYLVGLVERKNPKTADSANVSASPRRDYRWLALLTGGGVIATGLYLLFPNLRSGFWSWAPVPRLGILTVEEGQFVWGAPAVIALLLAGGTFYVGFNDDLRTKHREWWARVGAWLMIYTVGWIAVSTLVLGGPSIWAALGEWGKVGFTSGWLGATISGLLAGKSDGTEKRGSNKKLEMLAQFAPVAFVLGLLIGLSAAVAWLLNLATESSGLQGFWPKGAVHLGAVVVFSLVAVVVARRVDINTFSLHHFYRNRLARCYLGASNSKRNAHPFTGLDPAEDYLRISDLLVHPPDEDPKTPRPDGCRPEGPYVGPYHIVNTALNLVSGKNLAWQKRMAASFILTPKHCGYAFALPRTEPPKQAEEQSSRQTEDQPTEQPAQQFVPMEAFRPTKDYEGGISLATTVAISGAAASPNMGYHSSRPLAFLLTVFNVRLGWWFGNPREASWAKPSPPWGLAYLLSELFGMSSEESDFVYLSDGGHFENLGIYELVRRRCRYIIACDGSADPELNLEDLGNAIEKCRTDLGIDIVIDVDPLRHLPDSKKSRRHCAVGAIHYERMDDDAAPGTLVYIKASLTGDEATDVLRYAAQNDAFPHQSTGDQFFDESQFESYRELGEHIAKEVLNGAGEIGQVKKMPTGEIFLKLKHYWYPSSVKVEEHFTKHAAKVDDIYEKLRTSKNLAFLSQQIYPEWRKLAAGKPGLRGTGFWLPNTYDEVREGFYICNQVIQLMESVYLDLNLDQEHEHPDNRGWMNVFRHWSWSGMFRVTWAISASTYGARFQTFCERHLDLKVGEVRVDDATTGASTYSPNWTDLERRLILNFAEVGLLKGLIEIDRQRGKLGNQFEYRVYALALKVSVPLRPESIEFPFGLALTYGRAGEREAVLRCFRVQDHVRKMGLGRKGLTALIGKERITGLDLSDFPNDEPTAETEEQRARRLEITEQFPFPTQAERRAMHSLFESVRAQHEQTLLRESAAEAGAGQGSGG